MILMCEVKVPEHDEPFRGVALTGPDAPNPRKPVVFFLGQQLQPDPLSCITLHGLAPEFVAYDLLREGYTVRFAGRVSPGEA